MNDGVVKYHKYKYEIDASTIGAAEALEVGWGLRLNKTNTNSKVSRTMFRYVGLSNTQIGS